MLTNYKPVLLSDSQSQLCISGQVHEEALGGDQGPGGGAGGDSPPGDQGEGRGGQREASVMIAVRSNIQLMNSLKKTWRSTYKYL